MPLKLSNDIPGSQYILDWSRTVEKQLQTLQDNSGRINNTTQGHAFILDKQAAVHTDGIVAQAVAGNFGYGSTTTSISIYWDGTSSSTPFVVYLNDGTSLSVPTGNVTVTGLTAGTTYKFYPFYHIPSKKLLFVPGTVGTPAYAFTAANVKAASGQILKGRVAISGPLTLATPATGTGGGSGGGGSNCLAPWVRVTTKQGSKRLDEIVVGDKISCPSGWTEIVKLRYPKQAEVVEVFLQDKKHIACSPTHPLALANGHWAHAGVLCLMDELVTTSGPVKVAGLKIRSLVYTSILPSCEPYHEFYSNDILTHNLIFDK